MVKYLKIQLKILQVSFNGTNGFAEWAEKVETLQQLRAEVGK